MENTFNPEFQIDSIIVDAINIINDIKHIPTNTLTEKLNDLSLKQRLLQIGIESLDQTSEEQQLLLQYFNVANNLINNLINIIKKDE